MSRLVRSACTLNFEEHEFVEFFGIVAPLDEEAFSYTYSTSRDGLRLVLTVFPVDGAVFTDLFRRGIDESVFVSRLTGCTHSRVVQLGSRRCLEIGRPVHPTSEPSVSLSWGLRLFIEQHLHVEYIHEAG
jgi:hypothetical protein